VTGKEKSAKLLSPKLPYSSGLLIEIIRDIRSYLLLEASRAIH